MGSNSIYQFLLKYQPLISLHGHIHESPDISGKWYTKLKNTLTIQPGQSKQNEDYLIYVYLNLDKMQFERKLIKRE